MAEPEELIGSFVVEVGVRQAWPFLTFCDNRPTPEEERRLYIESGIKVTPPTDITAYNPLSTQWQALCVLDGLVVSSVDVSPDANLRIGFETGESLVVFGEQDAPASGPPWWVGQP